MSGITNIIYAIVMLLLVWPTYNKIAYSRPEGKEIALVPAFPGATGGGMYTTGGRGGNVIKVTNLNDKGPGSLREAIETPGKRTILFDVSGTIKLESQILVTHGDLTIAGHSAPGDGVCIKGHEFRIEADNIIIRYMRFRPGDIAGKEYDAITGMRNRDIIIDHCSMSWSTDEAVSFYDNENFTLQWSLISESLNNSVHSKGAHGYGGIWGGKNATFNYNILAHHNSRNPRLQGTRYQKADNMEKVEFINNIVYNWGNKAMYGGENGRYNITNNVFIPGPATSSSVRNEILEPYKPFGSFYIDGNALLNSNGFTPAGWENVSIPANMLDQSQEFEPFPFENSFEIYPPELTYEKVLSRAGASHIRDTLDNRIINEIRNRSYTFGKSGIIDSQYETEGWPELKSLPPLKDTDGDGIPDAWEIRYGLDPNDPLDGNGYDLDPDYTNLEIYLNYIITNSL
jgi:pectate lyase